jgi:protease-4
MLRRSLTSLCALAVLGLACLPALHADDKPAKKPEPAKKQDTTKPVIAVFALRGSVTESPQDDSFPLSGPGGVSLHDLVTRLKKAGEDPAVKAVVLLMEGGSAGNAQKEELRQVMAKVRAAGKEIYVHADNIDMGEYVLFSGASRISAVPIADLWITGLHGEAPYLRGLLDKLGVKPDFLHCGAYKSAAEMFMRDGPSKEAESMQNWLLDSVFETEVKLIARGRGVDEAKVRDWIDNGPYTAESAKTAGIIDAVEERQDFETMLKAKYGQNVTFDRKYGKKKPPKVDLSSPFAMFSILPELLGETKKKKSDKPTIGIVYVDGAISLGRGEGSPFSSATGAHSSDLRKALDEAARDNDIKAVVLRVDSPGGSAVASDIILDATRRVKAKKPFVVSMGNVAGSGGYYVACASDVIFADEATITASIGVVGGKMATNAMWKKAGITFKEYRRGKNSGLLSTADVFSDEERQRMQTWMDNIYGVFKGHVLSARGSRLKKPIDELAGGRVFTGKQALELGLVDKLGTLEDAIQYVAAQAKIHDYDVRVVPEPKNFIEQLMEELSGGKEDSGKRLEATTGRGTSLVELALPYLRHLDPQRVALVKMALQRLEMVQQEGAVLMMPEIRIGQ